MRPLLARVQLDNVEFNGNDHVSGSSSFGLPSGSIRNVGQGLTQQQHTPAPAVQGVAGISRCDLAGTRLGG